MIERISFAKVFATVLLTSAVFFGSAAVYAQSPSNADEWAKLVEAARAEGKVEVILSGQVPSLMRKAMPAFEKKYGIKVNFQTGGGREHNERILAERRVGRYTVDVWMGGVQPPLGSLYPKKMLLPIDKMLLDPQVTNQSLWYQGRLHYADPEGRYILAWGASPSHVVSFNTKLVNPNEIRSYWDLLNPKWKGKIVSWAPYAAGTTGTSIPMLLNPKVGEKWFRRWAKEMDVTIVQDARQGAEWVAIGRFSIGMFGLGTQARSLAKQSFPIKEYLPHPLAEGETLSSSAANIMALRDPPNPHAQKLFLNWALSREAHNLFIKYGERIDSLRNDVPNDSIAEQYRIHQDRKYFATFSRMSPEYADMKRQLEARNILRKIMRDAEQR